MSDSVTSDPDLNPPKLEHPRIQILRNECRGLQTHLRALRADAAFLDGMNAQQHRSLQDLHTTLQQGHTYLQDLLHRQNYRSSEVFEGEKINLIRKMQTMLCKIILTEINGMRRRYPQVGNLLSNIHTPDSAMEEVTLAVLHFLHTVRSLETYIAERQAYLANQQTVFEQLVHEAQQLEQQRV